MNPTEAALHAALKSMDLAERMDALAGTSALPANPDKLRVGVTPSAALGLRPGLARQLVPRPPTPAPRHVDR